jgi:hypothetical protein
MIDQVWVGHFERDGNFVRIDVDRRRGVPIVARPLSEQVVNRCLEECGVPTPVERAEVLLPAKWFAFFADGFLTFDVDTLTAQAVGFIRALVTSDGCDIAYASNIEFVSIEYLEQRIERREAKRCQAKSTDGKGEAGRQ